MAKKYFDIYHDYQDKYKENIRESDKKLISLISDKMKAQTGLEKEVSLLDIGCSTGNLLKHIKNTFPKCKLSGCDSNEDAISICSNEPNLKDVSFHISDIEKLTETQNKYDIITASALLAVFEGKAFFKVIENISQLLNSGGWFFAFDWFHSFEQEIVWVEKNVNCPEGLPPMVFRPYSQVEAACKEAGLSNLEFHPFQIPIDLEKPSSPESVQSYTVKSENGDRMIFRGGLYQPWCHFAAQKK